jgi:outer membrane protein assembly factor BamB
MKYRFILCIVILLSIGKCLALDSDSKGAKKQPGTLLWEFSAKMPNDYCQSAPAIGPDGTIYVGFQSGYLCAVNRDGSEKWKYQVRGGVHTAPLIDTNGVIYFGAFNHGLDALKPDGTLKWHFDTEVGDRSSFALGEDSTIYFCGFRREKKTLFLMPPQFFALRPDGAIKWTLPFDYAGDLKPAIALNGTIYIRTNQFRLLALNPENGQVKWQANEIYTDPVIGADGTIYCGSFEHAFKALRSDGTLQWSLPVRDRVSSPAVIGVDGVIYFGTSDGYLYAVKPDGTLRWTFETDGNAGLYDTFGMTEAQIKKYTNPHYHRSISYSPAINQDGDIIFSGGESSLYAVKSNGRLNWRCELDGMPGTAPTIDEKGIIYLAIHKQSGSESGKLVAIKGTKGLAKSPWPMFGKDPTHHARVIQ